MSSSVYFDIKNLNSGEGPTQRLDDTTLTAEGKYFNNFTQSAKRFKVYTIMKEKVSYLLIPQKYLNSNQTSLKQKIMRRV